MIKEYILPNKILALKEAVNSEILLSRNTQMAAFECENVCTIHPKGFVVLDFGKELNGGIRIICQDMQGKKNAKVRIRFGESAMECMADIGYKNATNDHSVRDEILSVPWVGILEYGNTGFRFVRVDNYDEVTISVQQIDAIYLHSGKKILGQFTCSDELLNKIWKVGARTIYLNNNELITDGIKRDRLVWVGDMHPESIAVQRLFGYDRSIADSLDYIKQFTPDGKWMNGIASYSMWWIKILRDLYHYSGDREYLEKQLPYIKEVVCMLVNVITEEGDVDVDFKFIDWPSSTDIGAQKNGLNALAVLALKSAIEIFDVFGIFELKNIARQGLLRLNQYKLAKTKNKQIAALRVFAGVADAVETNEKILAVNPYDGLSTFLGYYVLLARAEANDMFGSLNVMRRYYGAMLDLGATTFWEDFDLEWARTAKPIDAILDENEFDIHGDCGAYCYQGYRHSLCHGWSAGVVPFISEYLLGVKFVDTGCKKIVIAPNLGDLDWAEGDVPTPNGLLRVEIKKTESGVRVKHNRLDGVEIAVLSN